MRKKIIFFNGLRNGDIHVSRQYIKDIMDKYDADYFYLQNKNYTRYPILKDIKNLNISFGSEQINNNITIYEENDEIFINTWYAQNNWQFKDDRLIDGCNFYTISNIFKNVYNYLGIDFKENLYPSIDFNNIELSYIDNYIKEKEYKYKKRVLISTSNVLSGQSFNFKFDSIVDELSDIFDKVLFIVTSDINVKKDNVCITNDIINLDFDLNEISYLSTKCDIIVGRASGPYSFSLIDKNLNNKYMKLICFSNSKGLSTGLKDEDYKCQLVWSNSKDLKEIFEILKNEISKI